MLLGGGRAGGRHKMIERSSRFVLMPSRSAAAALAAPVWESGGAAVISKEIHTKKERKKEDMMMGLAEKRPTKTTKICRTQPHSALRNIILVSLILPVPCYDCSVVSRVRLKKGNVVTS